MRLPLNALCTHVRGRGRSSVLVGMLYFSKTFFASACSMCVRRRLDLDDVRAELRGDLRRVGDDVDRRLAFLGDAGAARVGPDDDRRGRASLRLER